MLNSKLDAYKRLTVYHGSYMTIDTPDLDKARIRKDFGRGFYTTSSRIQAEKFARMVAKRNSPSATPVVSLFQITDFEGFRVKIFSETDPPTREWLEMILQCRKYNRRHNYDIVIGAVADDMTATVLQAYCSGVYGEVESIAAQDTAIRLLESEHLKDQLVFCTEQAIKRLVFHSSLR